MKLKGWTLELDRDFEKQFGLGTGLRDTDFSEGTAVSRESVAGTEPFHMRCPNCRKLYSVEPRLLGTEDISKFECVGCQTTFFALKPELHGAHFIRTSLLETQLAPLSHQAGESMMGSPAIDGFGDRIGDGFSEGGADGFIDERESALSRSDRVSVLEVPVSGRECPSCNTINSLSAKECISCEIVFAQFIPDAQAQVVSDVELSASAELVAAWQSVQANYTALEKHENFVARCYEANKLAFAAHKYAQMLVLAPEETTARLMRKRIIGLASYGFDATSNGLAWTQWSFPLPSFNSLIILMGTILVVCGLAFPHAKQTAGLGGAMIALAIGLRVFLRRPRSR